MEQTSIPKWILSQKSLKGNKLDFHCKTCRFGTHRGGSRAPEKPVNFRLTTRCDESSNGAPRNPQLKPNIKPGGRKHTLDLMSKCKTGFSNMSVV